MPSIVALGPITVGINLTTTRAELRELGLEAGEFRLPSVAQMEKLRVELAHRRGGLPNPRSGGSVGNTASLIARAGVNCGMMGVGGDDDFGRFFVKDCENASLAFLSQLEDGAVTGYDFYLHDEEGTRTILLTHGANELLSPTRIEVAAIQNAELLLLDGAALSFGAESEAALSHCIDVANDTGVPFVLTLASTTIVDNYRHFFDVHAVRAQMIAGNLEQAAVLVGLAPTASIEDVNVGLAQRSINAIVTLDADGAFARIGDETHLVPTESVEAVDATGAGDSFLAAFLVARVRGLSVNDALAVGNIVARAVIQYESARLPLEVDVPRLLHKAIQTVAAHDD